MKSITLMLIKDLISFEKIWLLFKSKHLCQKNYDSTLAQSIKLKAKIININH